MKQHCNHYGAHPIGYTERIAAADTRILWCPRCGALGYQQYPNPYKGAGFKTREWKVPQLCRGAK